MASVGTILENGLEEKRTYVVINSRMLTTRRSFMKRMVLLMVVAVVQSIGLSMPALACKENFISPQMRYVVCADQVYCKEADRLACSDRCGAEYGNDTISDYIRAGWKIQKESPEKSTSCGPGCTCMPKGYVIYK